MSAAERTERVVIVGAGTAGLHAAFDLAEAGVASVVLDASPAIGGAVYRGPLRRGGKGRFLGDRLKRTTENLYSRLREYNRLIDVRLGTEVVGIMGEGRQLSLLTTQGSFEALDYDRLIVCMGCYERATPFPGWTLPGAMMLGGVQLQLKNGLVRPGQRIVVCGTGPLVPVAALQLQRAGVEIAGVFEANHFRSFMRRAPSALHDLPRLVEGIETLAKLRRAGVSVQYGRGIVEVRGKDSVEQIVVAPYDRSWNPDLSKSKVIDADCLATGYGFIPRTELTQLIGARHHLDSFGYLVPDIDDAGRTSLDGVYVAGDIAGIGGGKIAVQAGRMAAAACLADIDRIDSVQALKKIRRGTREVKRLSSFNRLFPNIQRPREGILNLAREDTVVCRCENVTRAQVDEALEQGVIDLTTLKMVCRIGMGDCQGRICGPYCRSYLASRLGTDDVGELRPRFPLTPVPFVAMVPKS